MLRNLCKDKAYSKMIQEAGFPAGSLSELQAGRGECCFGYLFFQ